MFNVSLFAGIAFFVLMLDQISKFLIKNSFSLGHSVPIINNIFHLTYVQNFGAAFGFLQHAQWLFVCIALVLIGGFIYFLPELVEQKVILIASALVMGGAIGNLIDRIFFGFVIDFFDFRVWPVFNIADSALCIGVGILVVYYLLDRK
ncbi:signal peptidase II [Candidatus Woesearchaeota archaeon]|nr:signal peptidase II [Candidatus Woesearchaeota archaeon]